MAGKCRRKTEYVCDAYGGLQPGCDCAQEGPYGTCVHAEWQTGARRWLCRDPKANAETAATPEWWGK